MVARTKETPPLCSNGVDVRTDNFVGQKIDYTVSSPYVFAAFATFCCFWLLGVLRDGKLKDRVYLQRRGYTLRRYHGAELKSVLSRSA